MAKVMLLLGTRPEAIKMAPVVKALEKRHEQFGFRVCSTSQHREMLDQVLGVFNLRIDRDLNVMRPKQEPTEVLGRALDGVSTYLREERPDCVLVQGDTTTTLAASLAAFHLRIPVGHVEAGLRTWDRYRPFPEEMNRKLTSCLSSLHFAPTARSRANLLEEGTTPADIFLTGNTAIDALQLALAEPGTGEMPAHRAGSQRMILVTAHRRESFGRGIANICSALRRLAVERSDVHIVYPVHYNPNIRGPVSESLNGLANVTLLDPVGYDVFVRLMSESYLILTDSGGVQEEAPSLGKPVLVLRECTERPEAVDAGTVRLVGTEEETIWRETCRLLDDVDAYQAMARAVNPYGDGHAGERIVAILHHVLNGGVWPLDDLGEFNAREPGS